MSRNDDDLMITPAVLAALAQGDLANALTAATPGGIEAQEAQGQRDFVASETLPTECPREKLEELGFIFGEAADDIFTYVQFPEGWKKVPTDHSMWSDLVDDKGRKRGGIFYKAAFYDRSAHMSLDRRFSYRQNYNLENTLQYQAFSSDEVIFETDPVTFTEKYVDGWWEADDKARDETLAWLNENYPDWENPMAYWD